MLSAHNQSIYSKLVSDKSPMRSTHNLFLRTCHSSGQRVISEWQDRAMNWWLITIITRNQQTQITKMIRETRWHGRWDSRSGQHVGRISLQTEDAQQIISNLWEWTFRYKIYRTYKRHSNMYCKEPLNWTPAAIRIREIHICDCVNVRIVRD